ncbi:MAG: nitroreductase [Alphaproteobacteria bacterium]|nr:nitroreductase [Alphaproteobacteria bacterium]
MDIFTATPSPAVLEYLQKRRSVKVDAIGAPGPTKVQMDTILSCAVRTPDHGKMVPWYFIVFEGAARQEAGDILAAAYSRVNPDARVDKIEAERQRFMRAPVVVAVVSRARKGKNPLWEQILSAGAVCMNLSLAAHASGFGACWLTEWYGYDENVKAAFGLDFRDHIAGFIYIGTPVQMPEERDRPDLDLIVNYFSAGGILEKGDRYDQEKFDLPQAGCDLSLGGKA